MVNVILVILMSRFAATQGCLDEPCDFEQRPYDRTTPDLASSFQTSETCQGEDVCPLRMIKHVTGPIYVGTSVELGFEPGALWHRRRHLTARSPRSLNMLKENRPKCKFYFLHSTTKLNRNRTIF
ncbi:hypothetical protein AVEN_62236-1 [Araneus ventricosus]|uniref:Uncharacterized protein n=1 Tax=Araneus ventricosus TaxID=182803 RepID=A0A4Y2NKJ2_ARAVE|nr:hypothetical protein AVEN_62236-1 [Araneus ventricosus]